MTTIETTAPTTSSTLAARDWTLENSQALRAAVTIGTAFAASDYSRPILAALLFEVWSNPDGATLEPIVKVTATDSYALVSTINGAEPARPADLSVLVDPEKTALSKALNARDAAMAPFHLSADGVTDVVRGTRFRSVIGEPVNYRNLIAADYSTRFDHAAGRFALGAHNLKRLSSLAQSAVKYGSGPVAIYPATDDLKPIHCGARGDGWHTTALLMPVRVADWF